MTRRADLLTPAAVLPSSPMRTLAFALYLLFVVSWFLHLPSRVEALGSVRFDLLLMLTILGLLMFSGVAGGSGSRADTADSRTQTLIGVLAAYAVVTVPFVHWPGSVLYTGLPNFIKALVFYYFTAKLVTTEARLRALLLVFIAAQTFRVIEPVYLHVTQGYWGSGASMSNWQRMDRLSGAPHDVINPNGLAFVILTAVPFHHYLGPLTYVGSAVYVAALPVLVYALLLTGSRSGLLGLVVVVLAIWLKSRRKTLLGALAALSIVAVVPLLSVDQRDRYRSIFDSNTRNAATAEGRWEGVRADFVVALHRPIFGHGLGTSLEANTNFGSAYQVSHNLYTEAAQELGFVGLAILVATIASIGFSLRLSLSLLRRSQRASPLLLRLADALQVFLAMNILFSFASYGLSSYEWYFAAGLSGVIRRFTASIKATTEVADLQRVPAVSGYPAHGANSPPAGVSTAYSWSAVRRTSPP